MTAHQEDADYTDFASQVSDQTRDALRRLGRMNLLLVGKTGTGKSTLVNAMFGDALAKTGVGRPVTRGLDYFHVPGKPLGLYDSEGFETGQDGDTILSRLQEHVEEKRQLPVSEHIHAVWYCLRWSDRRFEDGQAEFVRALRAMGLPVILVLTQVPRNPAGEIHSDAQALADDIEARGLGIAPAGRVLFTNAVADGFMGWPAHGLQELLDATFLIVPEAARAALTASQQIDLERKRTFARTVILGAAATAGAVAATPIPLADAAAIVPIQSGMIAGISAIYGLPVSMGTIGSLAATAFLAQGVSAVAKSAVRTLLKFVPGVNIAVATVQAGVAAAFTTAVGQARIVVCEFLHDKSAEVIEALVGSDEIKQLFLLSFKAAAKASVAKA
ncbi:GTPase family protein [Geodermatophilus sp. URMC 63]